MGRLAHLPAEKKQIVKDIHWLAGLGVRLLDSEDGEVVVQNTTKSSLMATVKEKKCDDPLLLQYKEGIRQHRVTGYELAGDGTLRCQDRLCVPNIEGLQEKIMSEAPCPWYSIHPGSMKKCHDLKEVY